MNDDGFNLVSILGVGLIGGSLALALKKRGVARKIIGYGRDIERLIEAKRRGIIDEYSVDLEEVAQAELIVLATPLGVFQKITEKISPLLKAKSIYMDVGSVKKTVVEIIEKIIPRDVQFVPTHPIAGSEKTGFEFAKEDLFKDARVIITPTERTDVEALSKISLMWQKLGARVELMTPEEHDKIYALMSHLPHLISFCLVNTVNEIDSNLIKYAGTGFRDTTRIAKSSPEIWSDIFKMNYNNILEILSFFEKTIENIKKILARGDSDKELIEFIERAKNLRERID